MDVEVIGALIPILGIVIGAIIPIAAFIWLYFESKDKNKTILEISKNIDDPSKVEDLINLLDERKKEPIDYRRTGVVTLFVGIGLFLFGVFLSRLTLKGGWCISGCHWCWSSYCWLPISKYFWRN